MTQYHGIMGVIVCKELILGLTIIGFATAPKTPPRGYVAPINSACLAELPLL
jgi:hypothetical protein